MLDGESFFAVVGVVTYSPPVDIFLFLVLFFVYIYIHTYSIFEVYALLDRGGCCGSYMMITR